MSRSTRPGIGIVGRGHVEPLGFPGEREAGLRQHELAVGGDAVDPHVPGCAARDCGVDAHAGQRRPPGQRDTVADLAAQRAGRARARTPVAGSVTASIESVT